MIQLSERKKNKEKNILQNLNISLYLLIILLIANSCKDKSIDKIEISGTIMGAESKTIFLEEISPGRIDTIASVKLNKTGDFKLIIDSVANTFHRLRIDENNTIFLRLNKGEKLNISATYPHIARNYKIDGSDDSQKLKEMNLRLIESSDVLNEMKKKVNEALIIADFNMDSLWTITNETARNLYESDKEYLTNFIKENHKSAVIYSALYQYIGVSPILMIENDFEIFEYALAELKTHNPELRETAILESSISKHKLQKQNLTANYLNIKVGDSAPDFVLNDQNSLRKSLSSFKGQQVLLIFWSSWSKTSLKEIAKLSSILKENNNIKAVLISLDTSKENWESGIKSNNLSDYTNLTDFKTWESPVVKIYGIKNLPSMFLIDKDGTIILSAQTASEIHEYITK